MTRRRFEKLLAYSILDPPRFKENVLVQNQFTDQNVHLAMYYFQGAAPQLPVVYTRDRFGKGRPQLGGSALLGVSTRKSLTSS